MEVPISDKGIRIGSVRLGFSRETAKREARNIVWLLLGTSVVIIIALSALVYWMALRMIVLPTREAAGVASDIAAGDLSRMVRVRSVNELGLLGRG
jgi:methyl-accepting chemotaxis protein